MSIALSYLISDSGHLRLMSAIPQHYNSFQPLNTTIVPLFLLYSTLTRTFHHVQYATTPYTP